MSVCYIIGAGDVDEISINKEDSDIVIAVDGGLKHCQKFGTEPDIILGDFDSLGYVPDDENVICLPVEKDDTDMFFAVKTGFERGFDRFVIFGGTGGSRPEHTYANIAVIAYISQRCATGYLVGKGYVITAITDTKITFGAEYSGDISVFSFSDNSYGVCEQGLKYSLENKTLTSSVPLGISNSFTGKESCVSVRRGTLIIYFSADIKSLTQ